MSLKTDKYIENAQRLILKGQLDKAAIDLEQAVALDPADLKVRQKLAEILIRINRKNDAISHYGTIGKSFSDSGFYLKAIAVYKQIQKLDPENTGISLTLAELNVNHGLIGNALSEFSLVVNVCLKSGKQAEALQLLERMREIDPSNLNTILKIAETLLATGDADGAYGHYRHLAQQLSIRPDKNPFFRLCERMDALFPERGNAALSFVSGLIEDGDPAAAFASLKEIIIRSPDNLDAWLLMADTIRIVGDTRQLTAILEKIRHRFPGETVPKEQSVELALSMNDTDSALSLLNEFQPHFIENSRADRLESYYNHLRVLAPQDERPLEGLCRLFEATGDDAALNGARERLAILRMGGDQPDSAPYLSEPAYEAEETVSARETEPVGFSDSPAFSGETPPDSRPDDWEEEIELGLDEEPEPVTEPVPEETVLSEPLPEPLPEFLSAPQSDSDQTEEPPAVEPCEPEPPAEPAPEIIESGGDITASLLGLDDLDQIPVEPKGALIVEAPPVHQQEATKTVSADPEDEISGEPEAVPEPDASVEEESDGTETIGLAAYDEDELAGRVTLTIENPLPPEAFLPPEIPEIPETLETEKTEVPLEPAEEVQAEPEFVSPWDEVSTEEPLYEGSPSSSETSIQGAEELIDLLMRTLDDGDTADDEAAVQTPPELQSPGLLHVEMLEESDEAGEFDDAFELEEIAGFTDALFGGDHPSDAESFESEQFSLGNMLTAFKKGVDEQLDENDTESHYNLGIAYKEMGLYDEAIREFRSAGHASARAADCITLQGLCLKEKGDLESAETMFREGLALPELSNETILNLRYELALLLEQADRPREALNLYKEITRENPSYRDASHHAARLSDDDDLDALIELKEED